ncbi:MAG: hypothetical protein UFF97_09325, partial [Collinsella sp.]|nr:hypothetical protein [Collinsella sp.]
AEVRHALLEVEDQVFGVHAAPIIAVYGVNDMAPWGHMYVNPGLTEPNLNLDCSDWNVPTYANHSDFNHCAPGVILPKAWQ